MSNVDLTGRWELVTFAQNYDDGRQVLPMGRRAARYYSIYRRWFYELHDLPSEPCKVHHRRTMECL